MDLQIGAATRQSNRQLLSWCARRWPASTSLILLFISQTRYKDMTGTSGVSTVVVVGLAGFEPAISWVHGQGKSVGSNRQENFEDMPRLQADVPRLVQ